MFALLAVAVGSSSVSAASWRPIVTLASTGHLAGSDSVAVSGSTVHLLYTRAGVITYRRSTDGGRTFGSAVAMATSAGSNSFTAVAIAAYGDRVAALYSKVQAERTPAFLFVKISTNGGRTWSVPLHTNVSTTNPTAGAVAVSSTGYWVAGTVGGGILVAGTSTPGPVSCGSNCVKYPAWRAQYVGSTTNRSIQSDPASLDGNVALSAWGNRVNVYWAPDGIAEGTVGRIVQRRSSDGGVTFFAEETVAADAAVVVGARPAAVTQFSTTILLAYQRRDGRGVVLRSINGGSSWSRFVATPAPTSGGNPDIQDVYVGYGGVARLVYASYASAGGPDKLWIRASTDSGAHWGAPVQAVGTTPTRKNAANIAIAGKGLVIAFGRFATSSGGVYARAFN